MADTAPIPTALQLAMSERQLQQAVEQQCRLLGLRYYHTWHSVHSARGFPDLVIVGARVLWRELKRQKENPTPPQQAWLDALTGAGQDAAVWRPSDLHTGRIYAQLRALMPAHHNPGTNRKD